MEDNCQYVCSRGLLKSCDFHSCNPKSSCGDDIMYLLEMLKSGKMYDGMTVYVCSNLLSFFAKYVSNKITCRFILISGDSDMIVPYEAMTHMETNMLFDNVLMLRWYSQNTTHPRIHQMPIGIDYHTIANNHTHCWRQANEPFSPVEQERILCAVRDDAINTKRNNKIFVNFSLGNDRFGQRRSVLSKINSNLLHIKQDSIPRTELWKLMSAHTFVLSPFGMGIDCHRTWEALCLGCIPIVMTKSLSRVFEELPVLIVDDWTQITEELLTNTIERFKTRDFNLNKLLLSYWVKKISTVL